MMKGRFLDCTLGDPYLNVAMEEALFRLLKSPAVRIWDNQRSVVVGRAQMASIETDLERCRGESIPVVRRFTAGGTVYNGPGNVNWSFFEPRGESGERGMVFDSRGVFSALGGRVVDALARCSAGCRFEPPNTIVNERGKVSGMAAYMSAGGVVCHGTLLLSADLGEVDRLTRPSGVVAAKRYPRSRHAVVANCGVERIRFARALLAASGEGLAIGEPTAEEIALAQDLADRRYRTEGWNLGDPFRLDDL